MAARERVPRVAELFWGRDGFIKHGLQYTNGHTLAQHKINLQFKQIDER